jgi:hypothetical protein
LGGIGALAASTAALAGGPPKGPLVGCRARQESNQPYSDRVSASEIRLGPLILTPYPFSRKPLTRSRSNPQPDEWPYVVKVGARVRAGQTVTLAIASRAVGLAAILPADTRKWVFAVRFHACAADTPAHAYSGSVGPVTGFGQVVAIKKPSACIPIEVWVAFRASPIRRVIAIGRPRC